MELEMGIPLMLVVAVLFFVALTNINAAISQQANAIGTLNVTCPFAPKLNALPLYARGANVVLNYTVQTTATCTINYLAGNFVLKYPPGGNTVLTQNEVVPSVTQTSGNTLHYLIINNTIGMQLGNYSADLSFNAFLSSNSSTNNFDLVSPANVTVGNFTSSPANTVTQNVAMIFHSTLSNIGTFEASNVIIYINVTGPANTLITQQVSNMSPLTQQNVFITSSSATGTQGAYNAVEYATYNSGVTTATTNNVLLHYTVVAPVYSSAPSAPPPAPVVPVLGITLTTTPLLITLIQQKQSVSELGITDSANQKETINLSVAPGSAGLLQLSASSLTLLPNETADIELLFNAQSVAQATYVIPLTITAGIAGSTPTSQTEYFTLDVLNTTPVNPSVASQVSLGSNVKNATGVVTIRSPANMSLSNVTVYVDIPLGVVQSASQITAYGLPSNISFVNNEYRISWFVSYLPAGQETYAYYTLSKVQNQLLLEKSKTAITLQSAPSPSSILKVVDIVLPTFYSDSTNQIGVYVLYTGTRQQPVSFTLSGPSNATVYNSTQVTNATPNQLIEKRFFVGVGPYSGTLLLSILIATKGANYTYSLPLLVVQRPQSPTATAPALSVSGTYTPAIIAVGSLLFLALAIAPIIALRRWFNKSRYNPDRAEHLIKVREQIKRSGGAE